MAATTHTKVLIIGGGIGGLALAAILKKIDIECLVLERSEKITPVGAGISLAPNCLAVLEQLGLYNVIQEEGQKLHSMQIHHDDVKWRTLNFTSVQSWFQYPVYSIERHRFHGILYDAAGHETVRLDSKVEDIIDDLEKDHVIVKVAGGQTYTADVVIGADGIRSVTRRTLAKNAGLEAINTIQFTGRVHMSGYTAPIQNLGPENLGVGNWLFYSNGAIFTSWPCKDNRQWYIGVKMADPSERANPNRSVWGNANVAMVNQAYGEMFHPYGKDKKVKDIVDNSERVIASNVFAETDFPSMVSGRVVLIGDAAHSMTSFFGQGACQAIEDAAELANALSTHYSLSAPVPLSRALETFSTSRESRAKDITSFSANYAKLHTARLPYGLGPAARKVVYAWLPVWGWMWCLKWLYGYQPTVNELPKTSSRKNEQKRKEE